MMKNLFYIALVVGIFFASSGVKVEAEQTDKGVISLNMSKSNEAVPNLARITFSVETTAETAQAASTENNMISNNVISSLKSLLDEKKDSVKTSNFSLRPNYVYIKNESRKVKDYTAYNSVVVQTKDTQKISKLIDVAIKNGANRTDNLSWEFENSSDFCKELYPAMVKELKGQADLIAKAAGASVTGIKHIDVSCDTASNHTPRMFFAKGVSNALDSEEAVSAPIESGKIKVNASVHADFYVK